MCINYKFYALYIHLFSQYYNPTSQNYNRIYLLINSIFVKSTTSDIWNKKGLAFLFIGMPFVLLVNQKSVGCQGKGNYFGVIKFTYQNWEMRLGQNRWGNCSRVEAETKLRLDQVWLEQDFGLKNFGWSEPVLRLDRSLTSAQFTLAFQRTRFWTVGLFCFSSFDIFQVSVFF